MRFDVLFDPFDGDWPGLHEGAQAAEAAGLDGVWLWDHLAGSVHHASRVLECWTSLTAIAASVPRVAVGPMVLNVANRDAGTLAVMASTLQEVSDGRLLLGVGAGGGHGTPYAREQEALGRHVAGDRARRAAVEGTVATVREVWTGRAGGAHGFLRPEPPPPIVIGAFGPRMAELAGRVGDGINLPGNAALGDLLRVARDAHAAAGRDPDAFLVTASADPSPRSAERLAELGVHRVVTLVRPPYAEGVARVAAARRS
jgi:alkanesulfonate monooxygenase SsuD/methylene tetrahydromethanopterin reductase-like flavin-dependent oxidoreductase (luciferase family)